MTQYDVYSLVIYVFVFIFGACIGSFLNVCIYRLPLNESLIKRNSHCMTCGTEIRKRDLIPIISWCCLKGKCHACGAKISPRYTVVEALNALLYLFVFWHFDGIVQLWPAILTCLLFSALIVVFFMDWDTQLINSFVCLFIALLGVASIFLTDDYFGLTLSSHIIGAFCVSVPLLLIALISKERAMGMGDVYLMAAAGLFLGTQGVLVALGIGLIGGAIGGLILKKINGGSQFAFGPFLSVGIAVAVLYGDIIGNWYMEFTGLRELLEDAVQII